MRDVPADLVDQMQPMPKDFTVAMDIAPDGRTLKWEGKLDGGAYEYGARLPASPVGPAAMRLVSDILRFTVWQAMEFCSLGRSELIHYMRKDRHTNRPGRGVKLSPEAQSMLNALKDDHEARMADLARGQQPSTAHEEV